MQWARQYMERLWKYLNGDPKTLVKLTQTASTNMLLLVVWLRHQIVSPDLPTNMDCRPPLRVGFVLPQDLMGHRRGIALTEEHIADEVQQWIPF